MKQHFQCDFLSFEADMGNVKCNQRLKVNCSKGTYKQQQEQAQLEQPERASQSMGSFGGFISIRLRS